MILLFAFIGLGALVLVLGIVGFVALRMTRRSASTTPLATTSPSPGRAASLPPVTRSVPHHPLSILAGCSQGDLRSLSSGIDGAIAVGAPLYNSGNFAGCYHLYEGTAADVERKLTTTCAGPAGALEAGRTRAASLGDPAAQAWAMRDAFDGLIDVLERAPR
jgi:hypothetical protein